MEFLEPLMEAAASIAVVARSASTFSVSMPEAVWKGRSGDATWCRLFVGDRYHTAGGMHSTEARQNFLPRPTCGQKGVVTIPSVQLKDIVSKSEYTRLISSNNGGTVTERVCDLHCRKIVTSPLNISFRNRAMRIGNRFFIDKNNGPLDDSEALKAVINSGSNKLELVMNWDVLVSFMGFIVGHNDSGGYAVCEVCQLSDSWYGVRNIVILGKEKGHPKPVEIHTASISHRLRQGKRYIREYHSATLVGAGRSLDMVTVYRSLNGIQPAAHITVSPSTWKENINLAESRKWKIPCIKTEHSIVEDGAICKETKDIFITVERPLFGQILAMEERSSKTSCPKLIHKPDAVSESAPTCASPLSLLGAIIQDSQGNNWNSSHGDSDYYVRADGIASVLTSLTPTSASSSSGSNNTFSVSLLDSGRRHKAGKRGTFPIYRLVPIARIGSNWYDLNTLEPTHYRPATSVTKSVRYIELGGEFGEDLTSSLSSEPSSSSGAF